MSQAEPGPSEDSLQPARPVESGTEEAEAPLALRLSPLDLLREQADAETATERDRRVLIGALVADGSPESLLEAERRLGTSTAPENWQALMRAALAEAAGEHHEFSRELHQLHLRALAALPPELGGCHISDDLGGIDERASRTFAPDAYVSAAFELRYHGVEPRDDGRWDWRIEVSARLLDADEKPVAMFRPPAHTYDSNAQGCAPSPTPGERHQWFVFQCAQRLPLNLPSGEYTLELTIKDLVKQEFQPMTRKLTIRVN